MLAVFGEKSVLIGVFCEKELASKVDQERVQNYLDKALETDSFEIVYGEFGEDCTKKEIARMQKLAEDNNC